jgi:hypothetical protein
MEGSPRRRGILSRLDRAVAAGVAGVIGVTLASACGSGAATLGTAGPATTMPARPRVAQLECGNRSFAYGSEGFNGTETGDTKTDGTSTDDTARPTAADALRQYLATSPVAGYLRRIDFEPAVAPSGVDRTTASSYIAAGIPVPTAPPPNPDDALFAHRDADGKATAMIDIVRSSRGWIVSTTEYCAPLASSGGATATTGTAPPPLVTDRAATTTILAPPARARTTTSTAPTTTVPGTTRSSTSTSSTIVTSPPMSAVP